MYQQRPNGANTEGSEMGNPKFEARWAYKEGDGLDANPYPKNTPEHMEWAMAMHKCQLEELQEMREELSWI